MTGSPTGFVSRKSNFNSATTPWSPAAISALFTEDCRFVPFPGSDRLRHNVGRATGPVFHRIDRIEVGTNDVTDFRGLLKGAENLPSIRERFSQIATNCRNAQQDILETFLDRGELRRLSLPTIIGKKRTPGLKLDNARP